MVFAESEKNILVSGEPLSQKDQERPPVSAFLELLINVGIRSITFEKGLTKEKLTAFLEILATKPELVKDEGGPTHLMESVSETLPEIVERLTAHEEHETAGTIIDRLCDSLLSERSEVRAQAAASLAGTIDRLPAEGQADLVRRLADRLVAWIRLETSATSAYEKICILLKNLVQNLIRQGEFAESIPILDVFRQIYSGMLEKNDAVHAQSTVIIRELASEDTLNGLFDEFDTNARDSQLEAGKALAMLGGFPLNPLLDMLKSESNSNKRIRIMRVITETGPSAVPVIRDHIGPDEPWYFVRNLAYLLGHIESTASADALKPLLLHGDAKVRQEALKSVYRIGGDERGPVLLSVLPAIESGRFVICEKTDLKYFLFPEKLSVRLPEMRWVHP